MNFGIKIATKKGYKRAYGKDSPTANIAKICVECNGKKGGEFILDDQYTRDLVFELKKKVDAIIERINETARPAEEEEA